MSTAGAIPFKDVPDDELTDEELAFKYAPIYIGPTWRKREDGSWDLPEFTLGWEIAGWTADYLRGEGDTPWQFTLEQLRFVLHWYALNERGEFINQTCVMQRMKGHGKDPLAAVLCLVEFVGPCRFDRWEYVDGKKIPVGKADPDAWVQIAAVNQSQTVNTTAVITGLMSDKLIETYGIKPGKELMYANGGRARLEAVTSSYRAIEGKRTTFTILNETHHWVAGNNGHKMYETIDGNSTKMANGRYIAITNAYLPGEDSVAERMREGWEKAQEGRALDVGLMYDSIEAAPHTPMTERVLRVVLSLVRGDSVWLDPDKVMRSIFNSTIPVSRSRRMWLNQIVAEEDALYAPADLNAITKEGVALKPGDEVVLGFDGGKSDDATALVAIRPDDGLIQVLGLWEKPDGPAGDGWEVPRDEVDSAVHLAFASFKVQAFYADVALWESYIDSWAREYGEGLAVKAGTYSAVGWDMRSSLKRVTLEHEQLVSAILNEKLIISPDPRVRRHFLNVRRRVNNYGLSFGKESRESPRKVDVYAATLLAHIAMRDLHSRGKKKRDRTGRGYFL